MHPILLLKPSVNNRLPSGPVVILLALVVVGRGNSVTTLAAVIRPI
jgi:hypothetical protein